jgi:6-pyruvoyltetrahydropterin/6-carboxytetrahydropterin synthase
METYKICINKGYFNFASGHFVIFDNESKLSHPCESLHGHNYRVGIELMGLIDNKNGCVIDFGIIKNLMKELLKQFDHQILIPTSNQLIKVDKQDDSVVVEFRKKRYVLPISNVVLLPISNTTAEMLAKYLLDKIVEELRKLGVEGIQGIEIEVEENLGQSAKCFVAIKD